MTVREMVVSYTKDNPEHAESVRKDCHRYVKVSAEMVFTSVIMVLVFIAITMSFDGDMGVFPQIIAVLVAFGFIVSAAVYCVFSTIEGMIP